MLTQVDYKKLHQKYLDEEWHKKFPDGLYYFINKQCGGVAYGHVIERPTSSRGGVTSFEVGGPYVGSSFYYVKKHKTFKNRIDFERYCKKQGVYLENICYVASKLGNEVDIPEELL